MTNVFINTLEDLGSGQTAAELDRHLRDLIGAVRATGKKGSLALTITVKPGQSAATAQIIIEDSVTVKPPKLGRDVSVFFADDNNLLSRNDPRQPKLWPTQAPAASKAVPENVNPVTGEITR